MPTLTQFRTRIAAKAGLDNDAQGDQTLIDAWVEEARQEILVETKAQVRRATMTLTAGATDYSLSSSVLAILTVTHTWAGGSRTMIPLTLGEIEEMKARSTTAAAPARFYAHAGSDLLIVYPPPAAGESITVLYVPKPTVLAAGDAPTEIPEVFQKAIEYYALREAVSYREGGQDPALMRMYDDQYHAYVARIRRWARNSGGQRPRLRPNATGRLLRVAHDPSQYP